MSNKKQDCQLSVVIPCYNCASTLAEAVNSIFSQDLLVDFEVIAVNDGSSDETQNQLILLNQLYPTLTIINHKINQGGGAARNTGIKASRGEFIYCMDADNVLEVHSLQKMVSFLLENEVDGVAFNERKYFLGKNKTIASSQFNLVGKTVTLVDMFNGSGVVLDNFMYRRKDFEFSGGYPVQHGFDTQAFEIRFLSKGLTVGICPETLIWHRQRGKDLSYFERVYESGEYSKNMYLIYEDIFDLFSSNIQQKIVSFDVFSRNSLLDNILIELQKQFALNPVGFFSSGDSKAKFHQSNKWNLAINYYKKGKYSEALRTYSMIIDQGFQSPVIFWNILRCLSRGDESVANSHCAQLQTKTQKSILRASMFSLLSGKIARIMSLSG